MSARFAEAFDLQQARRYAEAARIYAALAKTHLTVNLAQNLAMCLEATGDYAGAEHWLAMAAGHRPDDPVVKRLMGSLLAAQGRLDEAEQAFRVALALRPGDPGATLALAALLLSVGRFAEGWPLMEARLEVQEGAVPQVALPYPEWRGEPLAGRSVLVAVEQALGDQIQMARFAQTLKARGAGLVTLACRPPLVSVLETAPGVDAVVGIAAGEAASVPRHDCWTRYFSLPARLGITLETLPAAPYLFARPERRARWRGFSGVGLAWQASAAGFNGAEKSLSRELADELLDLGCVSLRPEDTSAQDLADTAAVIDQLDLVISVDTAAAHLAGAMGKPCWTLLPALRTDWRWMRDRSDSPWYPTMRLFRQRTPGDWRPIVEEVKAALAAR
ncbi:tetratricopeptide repeat protein [Phenylobacterium sp.]|uniref:tetratricopeptide repeat protein n=1 Tax=Phenylobacterium sp. TaxID=1871053 RepID=UPI003983D411